MKLTQPKRGCRCLALCVVVLLQWVASCTCITNQPPATAATATSSASSSKIGAAIASSRRKVILDHDAGVDDFITLLLLLASLPDLELLGVTISAADSVPGVALNTTLKLMQTMGTSDVPVALSTLPGVNPFPTAWRWQGARLETLPLLNQAPLSMKPANIPAQQLLLRLLQQQQEPVTIVATGPLSNVAYALQQGGPAVAAKVAAVWWMGGALQVPGNVSPGADPASDGSAEWNAFWDPPSVGAVWAAGVPVLMVPLDATNQVPITRDLLYRFGPQAHQLYSNLVGTMWSTVITWNSESPGRPYYAWDTLTAACSLAASDAQLCDLRHGLLTAVCLAGPQQGRTVWLGNVTGPGQGPTAAEMASAAADACGCKEPGVAHTAGHRAASWLSVRLPAAAWERPPWRQLLQPHMQQQTHGPQRQPASPPCVSPVTAVSAVLSADTEQFADFLLHALNR